MNSPRQQAITMPNISSRLYNLPFKKNLLQNLLPKRLTDFALHSRFTFIKVIDNKFRLILCDR